MIRMIPVLFPELFLYHRSLFQNLLTQPKLAPCLTDLGIHIGKLPVDFIFFQMQGFFFKVPIIQKLDVSP